jgi:hypothetical protein
MTFDGRLSTIIDKDQKINRVLDVGTGTEIWAIDFGLQYPIVIIETKFLTLFSG